MATPARLKSYPCRAAESRHRQAVTGWPPDAPYQQGSPCEGRPDHSERPTTPSSSSLLSVNRRLAIHDVKVVPGAEDDCTIRDLPGAQFRYLRGGITFGHPLGNLEVFHIDVDALIAC